MKKEIECFVSHYEHVGGKQKERKESCRCSIGFLYPEEIEFFKEKTGIERSKEFELHEGITLVTLEEKHEHLGKIHIFEFKVSLHDKEDSWERAPEWLFTLLKFKMWTEQIRNLRLIGQHGSIGQHAGEESDTVSGQEGVLILKGEWVSTDELLYRESVELRALQDNRLKGKKTKTVKEESTQKGGIGEKQPACKTKARSIFFSGTWLND